MVSMYASVRQEGSMVNARSLGMASLIQLEFGNMLSCYEGSNITAKLCLVRLQRSRPTNQETMEVCKRLSSSNIYEDCHRDMHSHVLAILIQGFGYSAVHTSYLRAGRFLESG